MSNKWVIAILILVAIIIVLWMIGKKSVKAEVTINASVDEVWKMLSNTSEVTQWNKVLIPVEGALEEGGNIKYEFYQEENGKAAVMGAKVIKVTPKALINQQGGMPLILTFNHRYIIEGEGNSTKVSIKEEYRGVMVPFWNPAPVEKAYARLLVQLKNHVENG